MKKISLFCTFTVLFAASCFAQNHGLSVGDALPNPVISLVNSYDIYKTDLRLYDIKNDEVLLIVFMPDISSANPTSKIITTSLDAYFAEGLSFRSFDRYSYENPNLQVLAVTPNPDVIALEQMAKYGLDFNVISDENMEIAGFFGINKWENSKDASHIYIADKENKIVYARSDYRGEGEKLKEILSKLYSLFDLNESIHGETDYPLLMQGDDARDFNFEYINDMITAGGNYTMSQASLSDYFGKKSVLIAFYPAPYSYSCAAELTRFDTYAEKELIDRIGSSGKNDLELLMVSVSNYYILEKWKKDMGFDNVKLVSDDNGKISMKYNSYNMLGWNKRTVFLINKEGKVQYIDWDYNVEDDDDFGILKEQITASK